MEYIGSVSRLETGSDMLTRSRFATVMAMPNVFQVALSITKAASSFLQLAASVCSALQRLAEEAL